MEKVLIFGAGYLGNRIGSSLGYGVVPRSEVDVLDMVKLIHFLNTEKPQVVINAVGKTGHPGSLGIDGCKLHEAETFASNVDAAENISIACQQRKIYFVHLGSGCIYRGDNEGKGFSEEDEANFRGVQFYSDTKIAAEEKLKVRPGLILRIRMPIDDRPHPRNLIDKLKSYPRVIDVQNSMTIVPDMIPAIQTMIERRIQGVYNFVNPGTLSAEQIMCLYKRIVDPTHRYAVMSLDELNKTVTQERSNCVLDTHKLQDSGISLPYLGDSITGCLQRYKAASK